VENLFNSIQKIQKLLDEEGIPSVVIGGLAVAAWGEPRVTRDVDLKVFLGRQDADRLLEIISADYVPLTSQPKELLRSQGLIFVQDNAGIRIDIMLADTPYDMLAIERGRNIEIQPGISARLCSPEDLIIYKIISTRARDHEDIRGVFRRQGNRLDHDYVIHWLRQFEKALDDSTLVSEYKSFMWEQSNE
jgi:hypothetical protein